METRKLHHYHKVSSPGWKEFFSRSGEITEKNVIFETICRSRRVASFSAFHEVCVNFLEVRKKSQGTVKYFYSKRVATCHAFSLLNWLIYFSICLLSSVGEFQRLVSESTGFIFYGPERFLGCMPPNMLAPMNIAGDECVLTMSEWFPERWLDEAKLWSVCLARDSPKPDRPLVSIAYPLLYIFFCPTHPPSSSTHILYEIFIRKLSILSLSGASFVFYNVCVCGQLNKSI